MDHETRPVSTYNRPSRFSSIPWQFFENKKEGTTKDNNTTNGMIRQKILWVFKFRYSTFFEKFKKRDSIYLFIFFFEYHFQSKYLSRKQADEEKGTEEHDQTYFVRQ